MVRKPDKPPPKPASFEVPSASGEISNVPAEMPSSDFLANRPVSEETHNILSSLSIDSPQTFRESLSWMSLEVVTLLFGLAVAQRASSVLKEEQRLIPSEYPSSSHISFSILVQAVRHILASPSREKDGTGFISCEAAQKRYPSVFKYVVALQFNMARMLDIRRLLPEVSGIWIPFLNFTVGIPCENPEWEQFLQRRHDLPPDPSPELSLSVNDRHILSSPRRDHFSLPDSPMSMPDLARLSFTSSPPASPTPSPPVQHAAVAPVNAPHSVPVNKELPRSPQRPSHLPPRSSSLTSTPMDKPSTSTPSSPAKHPQPTPNTTTIPRPAPPPRTPAWTTHNPKILTPTSDNRPSSSPASTSTPSPITSQPTSSTPPTNNTCPPAPAGPSPDRPPSPSNLNGTKWTDKQLENYMGVITAREHDKRGKQYIPAELEPDFDEMERYFGSTHILTAEHVDHAALRERERIAAERAAMAAATQIDSDRALAQELYQQELQQSAQRHQYQQPTISNDPTTRISFELQLPSDMASFLMTLPTAQREAFISNMQQQVITATRNLQNPPSPPRSQSLTFNPNPHAPPSATISSSAPSQPPYPSPPPAPTKPPRPAAQPSRTGQPASYMETAESPASRAPASRAPDMRQHHTTPSPEPASHPINISTSPPVSPPAKGSDVAGVDPNVTVFRDTFTQLGRSLEAVAAANKRSDRRLQLTAPSISRYGSQDRDKKHTTQYISSCHAFARQTGCLDAQGQMQWQPDGTSPLVPCLAERLPVNLRSQLDNFAASRRVELEHLSLDQMLEHLFGNDLRAFKQNARGRLERFEYHRRRSAADNRVEFDSLSAACAQQPSLGCLLNALDNGLFRGWPELHNVTFGASGLLSVEHQVDERDVDAVLQHMNNVWDFITQQHVKLQRQESAARRHSSPPARPSKLQRTSSHVAASAYTVPRSYDHGSTLLANDAFSLSPRELDDAYHMFTTSARLQHGSRLPDFWRIVLIRSGACLHCHRTGHNGRDCPEKARNASPRRQSPARRDSDRGVGSSNGQRDWDRGRERERDRGAGGHSQSFQRRDQRSDDQRRSSGGGNSRGRGGSQFGQSNRGRQFNSLQHSADHEHDGHREHEHFDDRMEE